MWKYLRQSTPRRLRLAPPPPPRSLRPLTKSSRKLVDKQQESRHPPYKTASSQYDKPSRLDPRYLQGSCLISISVSKPPAPAALPSQTDISTDLFFQEWQPLLPVLHRHSFLRVYEQYLANPESGNWQSNKQALAQLFLIFEIAALSNITASKKNTPSYEGQWRKALYSTSSNACIATLQCHVLAQICYLLRSDSTHLLRHRGIAVTMCHELGLHQGHKYHSLSPLEAETRKKVFWCQYVLDKYVAIVWQSNFWLAY